MKKLILSFGILAFAVCFSFAQNSPFSVTDGANSVDLISNGTAQGADLSIISSSGLGRTQLLVAPSGADNRAFVNISNSSSATDVGVVRFGVRGSYGILSVVTGGSPTVRTKNLGVELDPYNLETGEAFVISSGAFLETASPTIFCKVDANGVSTVEAKVQATVPAPDYVFASDYNLRSLDEVEAYINENSHLPEIPSAAEFEENGITLGKMSFDLLKKVEELTLYMIEMKKENEELKARINTLENK